MSVCHCLDCKRRTGSAFAAQASWPEASVKRVGKARTWTRTCDSGRWITHDLCPVCGSTVSYVIEAMPGMVAVPLGGFAPKDRPVPRVSVWEERKEDWVAIIGDDIERMD